MATTCGAEGEHLTQARGCGAGIAHCPYMVKEGTWDVEGGNGPSGTTENQEEKLPPQAPHLPLNKYNFCVSSHR